jgi:peptide/nickel transport system substrate-binding protein
VAGTDRLVGWDYTGNRLVPNIARGWEISNDGRVITIQLRRGMRWSDGQPFTADDFVFWFEDMYLNKELTPTPTPYMATKQGPGELVKVDTHTVQFKFPDPYYPAAGAGRRLTPGRQAHEGSTPAAHAPAHYLKQFHPKYVAKELDKKVKAKFDNWVICQSQGAWGSTPSCPRPEDHAQQHPHLGAERNPYSIWVDTAAISCPTLIKSSSAWENRR